MPNENGPRQEPGAVGDAETQAEPTTSERTVAGLDQSATDVLDEYTRYLAVTGKAPATIHTYVRTARRWLRHAGHHWPSTDRESAERYVMSLTINKRSLHAQLSCLRSFGAWAAAAGLAPSNPFATDDSGQGQLGSAACPTAVPDLRPTEWGEITNAFRASLERRGLTPVTQIHWRNLLNRWRDFVGPHKLWRATFRDVEQFMEFGINTADGMRNRVVALHAFYKWARREGLCKSDPTLDVQRPKVVPGLPRPIPDADLALGLALSEGIVRAEILLGATAGLRCIEMARLMWQDVDEISVRVHGKGNKWRVVPLHADARDALMDLERRRDGRVFPGVTPRTHPAQYGSFISRQISRHFHGLGINATAHQLRHWFATKALAQCHDIRAVQELLGHAGPNTTAIYTKLDPERLAPIVRALEVPGMPARPARQQDALATARAAIADTAAATGRLLGADQLATLGEQLLQLVLEPDALVPGIAP